jgi:DNA-binding CsgD family transcriptional regulator
MLSNRDLRAVLDVLQVVHEDGAGDLPVEALARISRLIGSESVSCNRVDHGFGQLLGTVKHPVEADPRSEFPQFRHLMAQHPGFVAYNSGRIAVGRTVALSDLLDFRALRRIPLYVDFYRPRGTRDQLINTVRVTGRHGLVMIVNRPRAGFTHRDRAVLDVLAPHLSQAVTRRERVASLTAAVRTAVRLAEQVEDAALRLDALTPRERAVVENLTSGATDREIGRLLGIGHRTVHKHLEGIYRKLGVNNRGSVVAALLGHRGARG